MAANRRVYEAQFQLGAKVQTSLGKGFGEAQKNLKALQNQAKMNEKAFGGMSSAIKKAAGIAAGYLSFQAIKNYAKESSAAAQAEIDAQTKLATIMRQRMNATETQIESILELTAAQQRLGVIGDEVQVAGAQQLASYLKQQSSLEVLIPAMNNLLAQQKGLNATQQDAVNIANMMGKVFIGQVGALRRAGVAFTAAQERVMKYGSEQQKAAMLAQVITENFGQMNAAIAQTDQGQLQQAINLLSDMQESIGKKIIPMQVKWAQIQIKMIPYVEKLLPLLDNIPPILDKIAGGVDYIIANWDKIAPIVEAVTVALVANKVATLSLIAAQKAGMIITALTKGYQTAAVAIALLREGNSLAAVAQTALNGTMLACPVTWIVAGIMAVVMAGYYLIKNWDKVRAFFTNLWNGPLNNKWIQAALVAFVPFIGIPIAIIKNWSKISDFFKGLWEKIGPILEKIGGFFGKIFGRSKQTVEMTQAANTATVPHYAAGTRFHLGGPAIVGEKGPELVNLPRGSAVTPADRTEQLLSGLSSGIGGGLSLRIEQNFYGPADKEEVMQANRESMVEFERKYKELMSKWRRLQFA